MTSDFTVALGLAVLCSASSIVVFTRDQVAEHSLELGLTLMFVSLAPWVFLAYFAIPVLRAKGLYGA